MTRKVNLHHKANPTNMVYADNTTEKFNVYLNRNLIEYVVAANVRRKFVIVLVRPLIVIDGKLATKKIRGKVKLVRLIRNSI